MPQETTLKLYGAQPDLARKAFSKQIENLTKLAIKMDADGIPTESVRAMIENLDEMNQALDGVKQEKLFDERSPDAYGTEDES